MKIACCLSDSPKENLEIISFFANEVDYYDDCGRKRIVENLEAPREKNFDNQNNTYNAILSDGVYHEQTAELISNNVLAKTILYAKEANYGIFKTYCKVDYVFCSIDFVNEFMGCKVDLSTELARKKIFELIKRRFPDSEVIILAEPTGMIYAGRKENKREATIMPNYRANIIPSEKDVIESFSYAISNNCSLENSLFFGNAIATLRTISAKDHFCLSVEQVNRLMEKFVRVRSK